MSNPTWRDYVRVIARGLWKGIRLGLGFRIKGENDA